MFNLGYILMSVGALEMVGFGIAFCLFSDNDKIGNILCICLGIGVIEFLLGSILLIGVDVSKEQNKHYNVTIYSEDIEIYKENISHFNYDKERHQLEFQDDDANYFVYTDWDSYKLEEIETET